MAGPQLVLQDEGEHNADNAHNKTAEEGGPKAVHGDADAEELPDLTGEPEEEGIDEEGEQPEGQENERAGQELEKRPQEGIHQTENEGEPDHAHPTTLERDP